jgi:hypothetical protein
MRGGMRKTPDVNWSAVEILLRNRAPVTLSHAFASDRARRHRQSLHARSMADYDDQTLPAFRRDLVQRDEGCQGILFSDVRRSYRDDGGNRKSASSFNGSDLLLLAKLADLAHTEIEKLRANDKVQRISFFSLAVRRQAW